MALVWLFFAIFARARFGDLRQLQGVLKDFGVFGCKVAEIGYIEARSNSRKPDWASFTDGGSDQRVQQTYLGQIVL